MTRPVPTGAGHIGTGAQEVFVLLGLSSWAPVVSGTAALGSLLLVEIAHYRVRAARRIRITAVWLAVLAVAALVAAAFGW